MLPARSADRSAKGPWPVGAKHATVGALSVEIWYPATIGSDAGKERVRYDIRADLPADQAAKISDTETPLQPCDCVRELPIDTAHGTFPLIVFIHGTAGFKTQNLDNAQHWASRGFVVMSANHPGLSIGSFVGGGGGFGGGGQNLKGDVQAEIAAMGAATGDLAMFAGRVDLNRIGLSGHSAGGNGVAGMGDLPGVKVIVPLAANTATTGASVQSSMFIGGTADGVVQFSGVTDGYTKSAVRSHKRLVGIKGAAHTGVTSLCEIKNPAGKSIVDVAKESGVLSGLLGTFAGSLFDCNKNTTPQVETVPMVNAASTAAFEETLQCDASAGAAIDAIQTQFPKVEIYKHEP
jgi:Platelet-activating factor acetylhydrolase, isoform II